MLKEAPAGSIRDGIANGGDNLPDHLSADS
jgi:hypothetical protein